MMHMANAAATQGLDIGKERLREYIMSNESAKQAMGMQGRSNDDIDMDTLNKDGKKKDEAADSDEI